MVVKHFGTPLSLYSLINESKIVEIYQYLRRWYLLKQRTENN